MNRRPAGNLGFNAYRGFNAYECGPVDIHGTPLLVKHKPTKRQLRLNKKIGTLLVAVRLGMKPLRVYRDTGPEEIKRMITDKINALNRAQSTQEHVVSRKKKGRAKNAGH